MAKSKTRKPAAKKSKGKRKAKAAAAIVAAPMGRPTDFTAQLGDKICSRISDGLSMRKVCTADDMPDKSTVYRWLRTESLVQFRDQYARACGERGHLMAEEAIEITDETVPFVYTQFGKHMDAAAVARNRQRADIRKWFASKLNPKVYSEKLVAEHTGADGGPIQTQNIETPDFAAIRAKLLKSNGRRSSATR